MTMFDGSEYLARIGQLMADSVPHDADRALSYAECEHSVAGADIFFLHRGTVGCTFGGNDLPQAWLALWDAMRRAEPEPWRAAVLTLDLETGRFRTSFVYTDAFDVGSHAIARRQPYLDAEFGGLPVNYHPLDL